MHGVQAQTSPPDGVVEVVMTADGQASTCIYVRAAQHAGDGVVGEVREHRGVRRECDDRVERAAVQVL